MNLYRKLVNFFTEVKEVLEVKERIKLFPKQNTLDAQMYLNGKWHSVKSYDLSFVQLDVAVERAKAALANYKTIGMDDEGVVSL
ncbi:hypothetical protein Kassivere_00144 [Pseudomonas phage vB_PpuM-Kassivere]